MDTLTTFVGASSGYDEKYTTPFGWMVFGFVEIRGNEGGEKLCEPLFMIPYVTEK